MLFPALMDLLDDENVTSRPVAVRAYAQLLKDPKIFAEAREVKVVWLTKKIGRNPTSSRARNQMGKALDLLTKHGYLVEHGRTRCNVRRLTVAMVRELAQKAYPVGGSQS